MLSDQNLDQFWSLVTILHNLKGLLIPLLDQNSLKYKQKHFNSLIEYHITAMLTQILYVIMF